MRHSAEPFVCVCLFDPRVTQTQVFLPFYRGGREASKCSLSPKVLVFAVAHRMQSKNGYECVVAAYSVYGQNNCI